ncbi:TPA: TIGR04255 family protein [Stenotrophomonas maltophilia]|nr:TIGR04255 family protein [Stenotrophomonas maltophilia]
MARVRNLSAPPIQEAVIDFLFDCEPLSEDRVRRLSKTIGKQPGWTTEDIRQIKSTVNLQDPSSSAYSDTFEGVLSKSADELNIVQIRGDRITVSNVWSYRHWESLEEFAFSCVDEFVREVGSVAVKRLATRFINAMPLKISLEEMLSQPPRVDLADAEVAEFFDRKLLKFKEGGLIASFSLGTSTTPVMLGGNPVRALIVDVDAYMDGVFSCDRHSLNSALSELRDAKNRIFFGALTEAALGDHQ